MLHRGLYQKYFKRLLDIVLSAVSLILLSPIMVGLVILVRVKLGKPVLFQQQRPGKKDKYTGEEQIFALYKFRTMTDRKDSEGKLLPDEQRLTAFGKKLRSTSLDELPELWNILKGDMSIVGPRPLLVQYLPLYSERQRHRHDVRPGFTGLAQVHGRNSISWQEKFEWDIKYVQNVTFLGDVKIILQTIKTVIRRDGISSDTSVTMEEFKGNENK